MDDIFKITTNIREEKGSNLIESLDSYTVIDLETTGLDPTYDSIIEVSAMRVESGRESDYFQSLVNPGCKIDEFITALTGITGEMLSVAPTIESVLPNYLDFLGSSVIVGHNANFDINFLYDNALRILKKPFDNDFIDTMRISRRLFKEERHHRLSDLVKRFGIANEVAHRSLSDCKHTLACYEYLKTYATTNQIELSSLYPIKKGFSAKDVYATSEEFDTTTAIYGNQFVFTGALEKMLRKEAMQLVVNMGGTCGDSVNKKTNFLVLGNNDYCTTIKDGKSSKQKTAEKLKLSGSNIAIISENVFYEMISE